MDAIELTDQDLVEAFGDVLGLNFDDDPNALTPGQIQKLWPKMSQKRIRSSIKEAIEAGKLETVQVFRMNARGQWREQTAYRLVK